MPVYRAKVTRITVDGVFVEIPQLGGPGFEYGPLKFNSGSLGFAPISVVDTASIDLSLTGSDPQLLTATAKPGALPVGTITSPADRDAIQYNGTEWVNVSTIQLEAGEQFMVGNSGSDAAFAGQRSLAGDFLITGQVGSESFRRFRVQMDGTVDWGPGSGASDTNLYRSAAGILKTDSDFNYGTKSLGRGHIGANVRTSGLAVISSTGTETAVSSANWDSEPTYTFVNNRLYRVLLKMAVSSTSSNDVLRIRVRKGAQTTSGTEVMRMIYPFPVTATTTMGEAGYIKNTSGSNVSSKMSLTIERIAGSGTPTIGGDTNTPLVVAFEDIGSVSDHAELASFAKSV